MRIAAPALEVCSGQFVVLVAPCFMILGRRLRRMPVGVSDGRPRLGERARALVRFAERTFEVCRVTFVNYWRVVRILALTALGFKTPVAP